MHGLESPAIDGIATDAAGVGIAEPACVADTIGAEPLDLGVHASEGRITRVASAIDAIAAVQRIAGDAATVRTTRLSAIADVEVVTVGVGRAGHGGIETSVVTTIEGGIDRCIDRGIDASVGDSDVVGTAERAFVRIHNRATAQRAAQQAPPEDGTHQNVACTTAPALPGPPTGAARHAVAFGSSGLSS